MPTLLLLLWMICAIAAEHLVVVEQRIDDPIYTAHEKELFASEGRAAFRLQHTVTIAIKPFNMDVLEMRLLDEDALLASGRHYTRRELDRLVGNEAGTRVVLDYLGSRGGISGQPDAIKVSRGGSYITVRGPVSVLEGIFHTQITSYRHLLQETDSDFEGEEAAPASAPAPAPGLLLRAERCSLPSQVAAHVLGVFDLVHFPITLFNRRRPMAASSSHNRQNRVLAASASATAATAAATAPTFLPTLKPSLVPPAAATTAPLPTKAPVAPPAQIDPFTLRTTYSIGAAAGSASNTAGQVRDIPPYLHYTHYTTKTTLYHIYI